MQHKSNTAQQLKDKQPVIDRQASRLEQVRQERVQQGMEHLHTTTDIQSADVEQIVMESADTAREMMVPSFELAELDYWLRPKFSKFHYRFRLFNSRYLKLDRVDLKGKELGSTEFHVGLLTAEFKKSKSTAWLMFTGAILLLLATGGLVYLQEDWTLIAGTGLLSTLLFAVHYYSYRETSMFYTRSGDVPLLHLSHRCECNKSLCQFIEVLSERIKANPLPKSHAYLAKEMAWHRELAQKGWLSDVDYHKAKKRLMKLFNCKPK